MGRKEEEEFEKGCRGVGMGYIPATFS